MWSSQSEINPEKESLKAPPKEEPLKEPLMEPLKEEKGAAGFVNASKVTTNTFAGYKLSFNDGKGQLIDFTVIDPATKIRMVDVDAIDTPSPYILGLRDATKLCVTKLLTENVNKSLQTEWNMAKRSGRQWVQFCAIENGYFNEKQYHSYAESGMTIEPNRYPLALLIFGVDKYKEELGIVELKKIEDKPKFIKVFEDEIRRFPLPTVLQVLTQTFVTSYHNPALRFRAVFEEVFRDESGVQNGMIRIMMHWD